MGGPTHRSWTLRSRNNVTRWWRFHVHVSRKFTKENINSSRILIPYFHWSRKFKTLNRVSRKNPFHPLIWGHRHQRESLILPPVSVENRVSSIYERFRRSQHSGLNVAFFIAFDQKANASLISFLRPVSFELVCLCTATQNCCKDTKMAPLLDFCRGMCRPGNWCELMTTYDFVRTF